MKLFYLLIPIFLLTACTSTQKVTQQPEEIVDPGPEWVQRRPIDTDYYIGIGRSNKKINPSDYAQIAKRNALQDLVSEIEVKVESNSLLKQLETQTSFEERFLQSVRVQSAATISDYEQVDQWEDEGQYYIYYRLSKKRYLELKQQRIDRAVKQAQSHRQDAATARRNQELVQSFRSQVLAFKALEPFLNEPIMVDDPQTGEKQYLGNVVMQDMKQLLRSIKITGNQKAMELTYGIVPDRELTQVKVTGEGEKPQNQVPLIYDCNLLYPDRVKVETRFDGVAMPGFKRASRRGTAQLEVRMDMQAFFAKGDPMYKLMIRSFDVPECRFDLVVRSPRVQLNLQEKKFGQMPVQNTSGLRSACQKSLIGNGMQYEADINKSDIVIEVQADTREAGEFQGLYTAILEGEATVKLTSTGEVLVKESLNGIKGVDLDYTRAGDKAYDALIKKIAYEVIPRLKRKLNGN
ncbi:LPP20 family lipoprotein [bacterium SCSIO 12741]|nr:LPP20 family lipoprotein [bacterium SCSIO 12741]